MEKMLKEAQQEKARLVESRVCTNNMSPTNTNAYNLQIIMANGDSFYYSATEF